MKESRVENKVVKVAREFGGLAWKWISNRRGVPDRIVLLPVPPEHREIVNRYVRFVETKAPGGKPTPQQQYVHGIISDLGYQVYVPDSHAAVDRMMENLK